MVLLARAYYVNDWRPQHGDHIVHKEGCYYLERIESSMYLGLFTHCEAAMEQARKRYRKINGCYNCSRDCHAR